MSSTRTGLRALGVAARAMLIATLVLGIAYTAAITAVGQTLLPAQANGSLVRTPEGQIVGSSLIGQAFTDADGTALAGYFQSRPSAAGDGYDAGASSGSNLGPENTDLVAAIEGRRAEIAARDGIAAGLIPADALTASASGLDPDISPASALAQVARVAAERGVSESDLRALVESRIQGRELGFLGSPRVNVLGLNLALDAWTEGETTG